LHTMYLCTLFGIQTSNTEASLNALKLSHSLHYLLLNDDRIHAVVISILNNILQKCTLKKQHVPGFRLSIME
jgi:hypothetical protein